MTDPRCPVPRWPNTDSPPDQDFWRHQGPGGRQHHRRARAGAGAAGAQRRGQDHRRPVLRAVVLLGFRRHAHLAWGDRGRRAAG